MTARKIPMSAIEQTRRILKEAPQHDVKEVTKSEAIRLLSTEIHEMQSKGYSLAAIAVMLSEKGIEVTAGSLKSHLSHAKGAGGKKALRKRKQTRSADRVSSGDNAERKTVVSMLQESSSASDARAADPAPVTGGKVVRIGPPPVPAPVVKTDAAKQPPARVDTAPRRSAFTPREDTEDI
jgi:hypothetical protein